MGSERWGIFSAVQAAKRSARPSPSMEKFSWANNSRICGRLLEWPRPVLEMLDSLEGCNQDRGGILYASPVQN